MPIYCEIVSQDRYVYKGDVDTIILPGIEGEFGVLPKHAPLLTVLKYGIITVRTEGNDQYFTVAGGIVEVLPDQVTVLADAAENVEEIDLQRAEEARKRAEAGLESIDEEEDADTFLAIQAALRRSNLRINAVRRYRHRQTKYH
jgi:F-type H+-transporting ATPase subunit epsilon